MTTQRPERTGSGIPHDPIAKTKKKTGFRTTKGAKSNIENLPGPGLGYGSALLGKFNDNPVPTKRADDTSKPSSARISLVFVVRVILSLRVE